MRKRLFTLLILITLIGCEKLDPPQPQDATVEETTATTAAEPIDTFFVTDGVLNLREYPQNASPILDSFDTGTILLDLHEETESPEQIGQYSSQWHKVAHPETPEISGWVYGAFIAPMGENISSPDQLIQTEFIGLKRIDWTTMEPYYTHFGGGGGGPQGGEDVYIPQNETTQMSYYQTYNGNNDYSEYLVVTNVPFYSNEEELLDIEIKARSPEGQEFTQNYHTDQLRIYDSVYGKELEIPAFTVDICIDDVFKPGVWNFEISQRISSQTNEGPEPVSWTYEHTPSRHLFIGPTGTSRSPFDASPLEDYQKGDSLSIYGRDLDAENEYMVGIYYIGDKREPGNRENEIPFGYEIPYYPIAGTYVKADASGEFTVELLLGNDIPLGDYKVELQHINSGHRFTSSREFTLAECEKQEEPKLQKEPIEKSNATATAESSSIIDKIFSYNYSEEINCPYYIGTLYTKNDSLILDHKGSDWKTGILGLRIENNELHILTKLRRLGVAEEYNVNIFYFEVVLSEGENKILSSCDPLTSIEFDEYLLLSGTVNDNNINTRDYPSLEGNKLSQKNEYDVLEVIGVSTYYSRISNMEDFWYKFTNNNGGDEVRKTAWIYGFFVDFASQVHHIYLKDLHRNQPDQESTTGTSWMLLPSQLGE